MAPAFATGILAAAAAHGLVSSSSTTAEPADAGEVREQVQRVEQLLPQIPDRGAALYFLATAKQHLGENREAMRLLRECLALHEGFDPAGSPSFSKLEGSKPFDDLVREVHRVFPVVRRGKVAFLTPEKDLFPEGLAYDAGTDSLYLSSMYHRKIVKISRDGKVEDFVAADRYNLLPVQGIRIDPSDQTIWGASSRDELGKSELLHFDRAGVLLGRYPATDEGKHDFNDLVVLHGGSVLLTDTLANRVYRFDAKSGAFTAVRLTRQVLFPNGIAVTDDEKFVYVADQLGVIRIDLQSGESAEVDPGPRNTLAGIDGLYWHKGSLVAVQNGIGTPRIATFRLSPDGLRVGKAVVLENGLTTPTTGALRGDDFYFIVNSEIDNLNGEHILDMTRLKPVRIAVVHLP